MEDLKELLITTRRKKLQAEDAAKHTVYDSDHYRQEGAAEVYAEFEDKLSAIINKNNLEKESETMNINFKVEGFAALVALFVFVKLAMTVTIGWVFGAVFAYIAVYAILYSVSGIVGLAGMGFSAFLKNRSAKYWKERENSFDAEVV